MTSTSFELPGLNLGDFDTALVEIDLGKALTFIEFFQENQTFNIEPEPADAGEYLIEIKVTPNDLTNIT